MNAGVHDLKYIYHPRRSRVVLSVWIIWGTRFPSLPHLTTHIAYQAEGITSLGFLPREHGQLPLRTRFETVTENVNKFVRWIEKPLDFLINRWKWRWEM